MPSKENRLSVWVDDSMHEWWVGYSEHHKRSISSILMELCLDFMNEKDAQAYNNMKYGNPVGNLTPELNKERIARGQTAEEFDAAAYAEDGLRIWEELRERNKNNGK